MIKAILEYKKLIIAVCLSLLLLLGVGYFFANQKSEPVYVSKIDKLMFDTDNQSPKYVITLPEKKKPKTAQIKDEKEKAKESEEQQNNAPQIHSVADLLAQLPSILTLKNKPQTQQLKYINLDEGMTELKGTLKLPKIATNGRKPWENYGKKVKVMPNFKRVSVLFKGVGLNKMELDKLNTGIPSEVAFSFSPYTAHNAESIISSRQTGHETYVDLLLPSKDVLKSDNGPMALDLIISKDDAIQRFEKLLNTGAPIGGIVINDGIADDSNQEMLEALIDEAGKRGLLIIDATLSPTIDKLHKEGVAHAKADFIIENIYDREKIRDIIKNAENIALEKGAVLIVAEAKPVIVVELVKWMETFSPQMTYEQMKNKAIEKPLAVVPVSNLVVE